MRRWPEKMYGLLVRAHLLVNRRRVKAAGSLLYMAGAVAITVGRRHLRTLGQVWWYVPLLSQLNALAASGLASLGTVLQHAEAMFR